MEESQEIEKTQEEQVKQEEETRAGEQAEAEARAETRAGAPVDSPKASEATKITDTRDGRIAELESQLGQAKQEAAENWNRYVRERAEMENFRKRQERLSQDRVQREKKALLHKVLGVVDNVERALVYQDTMDKQGLQQALRMLMWQMNEVLRGEGLTPVPTVGEPFNPYVHEAIEAVEDSDKPEGTIIEEVQKGYKMGDETLRPARVKVSAGNKAQQAE